MVKAAPIGLFFGSFNPVHAGHLILGKYLLNEAALKEIWFVVSPLNPFKEKKNLLHHNHRLQILRAAIEDEPLFKASDIEFKLDQPSYTVNTLLHLEQKYPGKQFALIMGEDNVISLHKWKNHEHILEHYQIYVYPRVFSGEKPQKLNHPHIFYVDAPVIEISSTYIRQAIKEKKDVRFLLPDKAYQYLREMHYYEK